MGPGIVVLLVQCYSNKIVYVQQGRGHREVDYELDSVCLSTLQVYIYTGIIVTQIPIDSPCNSTVIVYLLDTTIHVHPHQLSPLELYRYHSTSRKGCYSYRVPITGCIVYIVSYRRDVTGILALGVQHTVPLVLQRYTSSILPVNMNDIYFHVASCIGELVSVGSTGDATSTSAPDI